MRAILIILGAILAIVLMLLSVLTMILNSLYNRGIMPLYMFLFGGSKTKVVYIVGRILFYVGLPLIWLEDRVVRFTANFCSKLGSVGDTNKNKLKQSRNG